MVEGHERQSRGLLLGVGMQPCTLSARRKYLLDGLKKLTAAVPWVCCVQNYFWSRVVNGCQISPLARQSKLLIKEGKV